MQKMVHDVLGRLAVGAVVTAGLAGCGSSSSGSKPLTPRSFYGGPRIEEDPRTEMHEESKTSGLTFPKPSRQEPLPPPNVVPSTQAATAPTSKLPAGQFQLIGTVVAEVNGTPIYANKVLSLISKPLLQKAHELQPMAFRSYAATLISNQVQELVQDEVLYAAAERALSEEDRKVVDNMTQVWRTQQMTQAGGSIQVARSKATADGDDFDELCRQQHRKNMIELFRYRKLTPRIQVTIDDLRRYYEKHVDSEFTLHAAARFRLLEVSIAKAGSPEAALKKITDMHTRAATGVTDFSAMCGNENDSTGLASTKGDLGMKEKGSLPPTFKKVEDEVWTLQPGEMTNPIRAGDAFYLAKLEEVRPGHVRPFNEQPDGEKRSVQDEIKTKLQNEQFRELSIDVDKHLRGEAIIRTDEAMMNLCLDMAMQRYVALAQN